MKTKGSITVMMTFVFFLIFVMTLATLEHAYVMCGKTLALEAFDKSAESVLGKYYAPLFAEYGLLGVAVGDGFSAYSDVKEIEKAVADTYNIYFSGADCDVDSAMWDSVMAGCELEEIAYITDENGKVYIGQVRDEVLFDGITYLTNELIGLGSSDISGMQSVIEGAEAESKNSSYDAAGEEGGEASDEEEEESEEEPEGGFQDIWNTLTAFITDGFSGLWFSDGGKLSDKEIDKFELPSNNCGFAGLDDDTLFYTGDIDESLINSGEYVDELMDDDFLADFMDAARKLAETTTDKAALAAYAGLNMDSYLKDEFKNGALDYEQEYLIFGADKDKTNIRRMGWALFGIRLVICLAVVLSDPLMQAKIEEYLAVLELLPPLAAALRILLSVVWAAESAIVETAAILKGKSVDFIMQAASPPVAFEEIFVFTKAMITGKAEAYTPVSAVKLPYQAYLTVFTFITPEIKVAYRQMDIIELNIKRKYNADFNMDKLIVGFSVHGYIKESPGFVNLGFFTHGKDFYLRETKTAVFIQ